MTTLWEGDCVRHAGDGFMGMHAGYTRLAGLMERSGDLRGVRVQLPDGTIRIASERSLEKVDVLVYGKYAESVGFPLKGRRLPAIAGRA